MFTDGHTPAAGDNGNGRAPAVDAAVKALAQLVYTNGNGNGNGHYAPAQSNGHHPEPSTPARQVALDRNHLEQALRWREGTLLSTWASDAMQELASALAEWKVLQAAFYQHMEATGNRPAHLQLIGGYALPPDAPREVPIGVGVVGQAALSFQMKAYDLTTSGRARGEASLFAIRASSLVVYPMVQNDLLLGVFEFNTLYPIPGSELEQVKPLLRVISQLFHTIRSQTRIQELLEEANARNSQLEAQETVLKLKIEELNRIQHELLDARNELELNNQQLETRIQERTGELEDAIHSLRNAQSQLIISEKMASLGTLIAGVAHEINTPIGAVKAAATNVLDIMGDFLRQTEMLMANLPVELKPNLHDVVTYFLENTELLSAKEERQKTRAFTKALEGMGLANADLLAEELVVAGYYGALEPLKPLLESDMARQVLLYIRNQGLLFRNLRNILVAAQKTSKVVIALKSYTHTSHAEERVPMDLRENIETVMILYHNQLKQGITVQSHFDDVPSIMGNPDELSQVWTNLIQNAAQAMNSQGNLTVSLHNRGTHAEIRVQDSGKGIPPEIMARIFEPFFTTKGRGEGTGLGLDICRKIVEKHKGKIYAQSQPGQTIFIVEIPFQA